MIILHIAPNAPYNDYWGYQENLLPKYQRKLGNDVYIITSNTKHIGEKIVAVPSSEYQLNDGVHVIRLEKRKYRIPFVTELFSYLPIYKKVVEIHPDFIFFHGLISVSILDVIKYKKNVNKKCVIVQDNHMDYNIGFLRKTYKEKIKWLFYKKLNKKSIEFVEKVYGVTPWRKKYAEDYFGIPKSKTDVLIMGADDEKIDFKHRQQIRDDIRNEYGIRNDDFLIVTGGKIDSKKKIDILMEACSNKQKIKLLIFGNVANDVKDKFDRLIKQNSNLIYIGWIKSDEVYNYFFASDLVFFPGQHSVLWEQACASKVPCVFEKWDEMDHVNNGGNSDFVFPVTIDSISKKIDELYFTSLYHRMKTVAESEATDIYLYSKIAEKSLECVSQC